jgi:hypothetical protein
MATKKKAPAKSARKTSAKNSDLGAGSGDPKSGSDLDGGGKGSGKGKTGGAKQAKATQSKKEK